MITLSTPTFRTVPDRFLVAFSFAGEQRDLVRAIAEATEQLLGLGTVFYDKWYEGELGGMDRDLMLQEIYRSRSEVVVMCASAAYDSKPWTDSEWRSIRAREMQPRTDGIGPSEFLLPLRVGDGDVKGLLENAIWIDARQRTPIYLAEMIVQRLRKFLPHAGKPRVFLAQGQPDLDNVSQPVNRPRLKMFLEKECKYVVSPMNDLLDLDPAQYQAALQAELGQALAFVQLLSSQPWKPGRYDQLQFAAAVDGNVARFCFGGEMALNVIDDAKQRSFISQSNAIAGQFDDFKQHLQKKLNEISDAQRASIRQFQEADRRHRDGTDANESPSDKPLVRIAIRANNANEVWEPVFNFLYLQQKVELDELDAKESFVSRHSEDPCHGFLILCDEKAQSDEAFSPREALKQCREIQLQFKGSPHVPPVGIIFRAPPDPAWPRLLKCTPKCLHQVMGDNLESGLGEFLQQVRDVRRVMK